MKRVDMGQLILALGVMAIGIFFLDGAFRLTDAGGYSTVGPAAVPKFIGIGLIVLGGFLVFESCTGGFREHDEEGERELKTHWQAFAWITAGIIGYGLLIEWAGFIFSSVILYVATARAFGSTRWVANILVALVMASLILAAFNYGLGLNLPKGFLQGVLP